MRLLPWLLLTICLFSAVPARADRDIVYAARYYYPPGNHRISHFHLYRINPDGTGRTQLTYGNQDDTDPQWSPDGRQIAFVRDGDAVCLMDADGSDHRTLADFPGDGPASDDDFVSGLRWLPVGYTVTFIHGHDTPGVSLTALWLLDATTRRVRRYIDVADYAASPRGDRLFLEDGMGQHILSLTGKGEFPVSRDISGAVWLDPQRLVGVLDGPSDSGPIGLQQFDLNGRLGAKMRLKYPPSGSWVVDPPDGDGWLLSSPRPNMVVWALNEHDSTVGALAAFFQVSLPAGAMRFLAQGQFLVWSWQGSRFCTAPGRDTWPYRERKWDGTFKTVWAAPLQVGALGSQPKSITPGLVWVTGADWRKRQQ